MLENPYVVLSGRGSFTSAYLHVRRGRGRAARRELLGTVHVPIALTPDSLPDVLRAVASQIELPVIDRYRPPRGVLGSP